MGLPWGASLDAWSCTILPVFETLAPHGDILKYFFCKSLPSDRSGKYFNHFFLLSTKHATARSPDPEQLRGILLRLVPSGMSAYTSEKQFSFSELLFPSYRRNTVVAKDHSLNTNAWKKNKYPDFCFILQKSWEELDFWGGALQPQLAVQLKEFTV